MIITKRISVESSFGPTQRVLIRESLEQGLGSYIWPSSYVLAWYLLNDQSGNHHLMNSRCILELGSGVGFVGLVAAKFSNRPTILTDHEDYTPILNNLKDSIDLNDLKNSNVIVKPLTWGLFHTDIIGLISALTASDLLMIGADVFYDKSLYEPLLTTISFIMKAIPNSTFLTVYQERNARHSISDLLKTWSLKARQYQPVTLLDLPDKLRESFTIEIMQSDGSFLRENTSPFAECVSSMYILEITLEK